MKLKNELNELGLNDQNKLDSNEQNEQGSTLAAYNYFSHDEDHNL